MVKNSSLISWILLLLLLGFSTACGEAEPIVVTKEVIVQTQITATPQPTLTPLPQPTPVGGGSGLLAYATETEVETDTLALNMFDLATYNSQLIDETKHLDFQWSPDGTLLAYRKNPDASEAGIVLFSPQTGTSIPLLEIPLPNMAFGWSPDSRQVAFLSPLEEETSGGSLYLVNRDGSELKQIFSNEEFRVIIGPVVEWVNDETILFTAHTWPDEGTFGLRKVQIYTIHKDGDNLTRMSDYRFDHYLPHLSPSGDQLVFFSNGEDSEWDLFIMDMQGQNLFLLSEKLVFQPGWSPDGNRIVWADAGNIVVFDLVKPDMKTITSMHEVRSPAWSPDGEWIVFAGKSKENSYFQLYLVRTDGTELTLLTNAPQNHNNPIWQP
ncbi:MAG TPA: hypothetical protein PLD25_03160 [Chloroflexota bacterium]|nr:hypothetical protein [Chloroflexota bacterium]HUM70852.1 hypothetical protein [Chloroflexota bacterium]